MSQHDFFSKLVGLNSLNGSLEINLAYSLDRTYICEECEQPYDSSFEADICCDYSGWGFRIEYECPGCSQSYSSEEDAVRCCEQASQAPCCPVCLRLRENFAEAAECCLPMHPTLTAINREEIARAVASGQTWLQALNQSLGIEEV